MDTVADFNDTRDIFTNTADVEHYARRRGRREVEIALLSGCMSPHSERIIGDWLALDDARQRRRAALPRWGMVTGVVLAGVAAGLLAWLY
jgi:type VI protein secretion system component VasF